MTTYSISQFRREFPDERACLEYIFKKKYPNVAQYYFVKGRKCFANPQGKQIHPVKGTIFEKSPTPLVSWFYAIYLFSVSKNGVSAKELQRQLDVTYKTAWRIGKQIRSLMKAGKNPLEGTIEVDETYIGGKFQGKGKGFRRDNKTAVMGMVQRGGGVRAYKVRNIKASTLLKKIRENIKKGSRIMSDELWAYHRTWGMGYSHFSVNHSAKEYVRGSAHTNTIEGFWSNMKRAMDGTYHVVSPKHLQSYVDEFSFRYNYRAEPIFSALMSRI
ncbi:MAG: IS1595 family transposase [Candidatus Liptonbacteria bacterium]|nr:IS1595 family transposase [Candidatus Liptonbacteria bacterium]